MRSSVAGFESATTDAARNGNDAFVNTRDHELVRRWQAGDRSAAHELIERHLDPLMRFFDRKVDRREAEDLADETVTRACEGIARFRGESSFRTFLYAIARNVLYEYFRRKKKDERIDFTSVTLADFSPPPIDEIGVKRQTKLLLHALRQIPFEHQLVIELRYFQDLPTAEVAAVLRRPPGTTRRMISEARAMLERIVARYRAEENRQPPASALGTTTIQEFRAELADAARDLRGPQGDASG